MEVIDKNYWEKRWENNETGWDAGTITTPLKEYFDQLNDKNIKIRFLILDFNTPALVFVSSFIGCRMKFLRISLKPQEAYKFC